jgi:myo-inositol catabolism protein IolC
MSGVDGTLARLQGGVMADPVSWHPTHDDPLFILAMDHRESFGKSMFDIPESGPTDEQAAEMRAAKDMIFRGLQRAATELTRGKAGVLVDEQYGQAVIDAAHGTDVVLAVPIEKSGQDWFTLQWGENWLDHVASTNPAYAKVLVRDNPEFDEEDRRAQLGRLADVSRGLADAGVPFLYELLVPATKQQLATVGDDVDRYDRELRPDLVVRVIRDNQERGVRPVLWKVEGLETTEAARAVADTVSETADGAALIVLGRDAPAERLDHWLEVASGVEGFVGFAIGRSIWEDVITDAATRADPGKAAQLIAERYLGFAKHWQTRDGKA